MIKVIKSRERHHADFGWLDTRWHFSFDRYFDPANVNWGALREPSAVSRERSVFRAPLSQFRIHNSPFIIHPLTFPPVDCRLSTVNCL
jgi:hypothetical protein